MVDDVWNKVQNRLEHTYAQYAGKTSPLNESHRPRYLLNGLVSCGCCGGGYTITGKERYGCYRRKTQGKGECDNSRTITRGKLETRVLARLHQGLMTSTFAAQFATEVERLLKQTPEDGAADKARIASELKKADAAIERLLDRLETNEAVEPFMARLNEREALRQQLAVTAPHQDFVLPTQAELEASLPPAVGTAGEAADRQRPDDRGQRAAPADAWGDAGLG